MFASLQNLAARIGFWQTAKFSEYPFFAQAFTDAHGVEQVCYYTDRQTINPLTDLAQNFIRTYIHDDKTVYKILSIWLFKFLSYSVRMTSNMQTDRLPADEFCPKFERNLQIIFKDHIPNFIPVALIVFELSCSQTDRHTGMIPKLCFSDSGRSKTWRFVKISSSNFLTITILSLCILRIRESKNAKKLQGVFKRRQQEFISNLDNLFDIAHADALQLMKIEEDRIFLQRKREPGRPGRLGGVDKKRTDKKERARLQVAKEENWRLKYVSASKSSASYEPLQEDSCSNSSENIDSEDFPTL
ncbi:hypothetical protein AVEN_218863-1 [Araneus ventricosus]|uniref:Uncharacterized protein n=1 Tax=Araneus ventricosus TaxID=182803 RepID=A0A4Y2NTQ2_ARAVE|nr:hypothetical protein AVEN_218863-1 [Araneus ventricosus]